VVDRCCIAVTAPKNDGPVSRQEALRRMQNSHRLTCMYWNDPELVVQELETTLASIFFGGEALPQLSMNFGASGHAAYFGSPRIIDERTLWLKESLHDWSRLWGLDWNSGMLQVQRRCAEYFAQAASDRFFVSTVDNAGSLDALAHLRRNENALVDLAVNEENVLKALDTIIDGWDQADEYTYQIFKTCNDGGALVGWLHIWADGKFSHLKADISVMLSNPMFKKYLVVDHSSKNT